MKKTIQLFAVFAVSTLFTVHISAGERTKEKVAASPTVYVASTKPSKAVFARNIPMNMLPVSAKTSVAKYTLLSIPPSIAMTKEKVAGSSEAKSAGVLSPTAGTKYSHGEPTDLEQYMLELINRARSNPKAEADRLASSKDQELLQNLNGWNVDVKKMQSDFATYPQRPPLAFNEKLLKSSRLHSDWMKETGIMDHTGRDGKSPFQRMNEAGYNFSSAAENISLHFTSIFAAHAGFQYDWGPGNEGLGHRRAIMNFDGSIYREIGIGIKLHSGSKLAITENFGLAGENFILGVVYKDKNNNGFYDIGEGLPGVTITPSKGNYYAITSNSGGYAIPVQGVSGSVTVEASGGGLGAIVTKNISLSGENVKVDFTSPLPGQVSLSLPTQGEILGTQSVTFKWFKSPGNISGYAFQLADNDSFFDPIVTNEDLTDTSITVPNLKNGATYYWHVKAKTPAGWGDYTDPNDFSIYIIPGKPQIVSAVVKAISMDSLKCVWNKVEGVTNYWIELSEIDNFFKTVVLDSSLTDTSYTFRNLEFGKTYYWHVKAKNTELWGEFSDDRTFNVMQLPKPVVQAYPDDNYTTKNTSIRFGWLLKEFATLESYRFEIATDAEMKNIFMVDSTLTDTFTVLTTLTPGVQYYWRVSQSNEAGWGEFSAVRTVMITTTDVDNDMLAAKFNASATPNPTSNGVVISFELPRIADASLTIVNGIGQTVSTLTSGMLTEGKHQFVWDARHVESGVYFYRLKAGNDVLTMPIVVVK